MEWAIFLAFDCLLVHKMPDMLTAVKITCHKVIVEYVLWILAKVYLDICSYLGFEFNSGPTAYGTDALIELKVAICYNAKEFHMGFK